MIHQLIPMELKEEDHQPLNCHQHQVECFNHHEDDDDCSDTLSLCDLPLNDAAQGSDGTNSSSSYQEADLFEFFTLPTTNVSDQFITPADQVISSGKLVPFNYNYKQQEPITETATAPRKFHSERFPSRPSKHSPKQHSPAVNLVASPTRHHQQQQPGMKKYSTTMIVFGFGKNIPTEMGLSDIKKRQSRMTPKPLVPAEDEDDGGKLVVAGKGKWRLMRSLFGSRRSHYGITTSLTRSSFNCLAVV